MDGFSPEAEQLSCRWMVSPALNTMRAPWILLLLAVAVPLHGKPLWKRHHDGGFPETSMRHYPSFHTENAEYIPLEILHPDGRISTKIYSALNHIHNVVFNKTHPRGHDWSLRRPPPLPYPPITQHHQETTVSQPTLVVVHSEVLQESSSTSLGLPHISKPIYPKESLTHATTPTSLIPQQINTKSPQNETSPNSIGARPALALPEEETQTTQLIPYSFIQRETTPIPSISETTISLSEEETETAELIPDSSTQHETAPSPSMSEATNVLQEEETETTPLIPDSLTQHETAPSPSISKTTNDLPEEETETTPLIPDTSTQHETSPTPSMSEATNVLPEEETETTPLIPDSLTQHEAATSPSISEITNDLPEEETQNAELIPESSTQHETAPSPSISETTNDLPEEETQTTPLIPDSLTQHETAPSPSISETTNDLPEEETQTAELIPESSTQHETAPSPSISETTNDLPEEETQTAELIPESSTQHETAPSPSISETTNDLPEEETQTTPLIPDSLTQHETAPSPSISETTNDLPEEETQTAELIPESSTQHETAPSHSISEATSVLPEEETETTALIPDSLTQHETAPSPSISETTNDLPEEETQTAELIPDSLTQHETAPSPSISEATSVLPEEETETTHLIPNSLIQQHSTAIHFIPETTFDPHETELSTVPIIQEIETSTDELVTTTVTSTLEEIATEPEDQTDESQFFENPEFINIISEYVNDPSTEVTETDDSPTSDVFETTTSLEATTIPTTTSDEQDLITSDEFINIVSHYIEEFPTVEPEHNTTTDTEFYVDGGATSQLEKIVSSVEFLDTVSRILNESTETGTTEYPTEESVNLNPETTPAASGITDDDSELVTSVEFIGGVSKFINEEFPEITEGVSPTTEVDDKEVVNSEFVDVVEEYLKEINSNDDDSQELSDVILLEDESATKELQTEVDTLVPEYISPEVDKFPGPSDDVAPSAYENCSEEDMSLCTQIVSETKANTSAVDQGKLSLTGDSSFGIDEKETTTPVSDTSLQSHQDGVFFTTDKADGLNQIAEGLETTTGDSGDDYYTSIPADAHLQIIETGQESTTENLSSEDIFSNIGVVHVTPKNSDQYIRSDDNEESVTTSKVEEESSITDVQTTDFDFVETTGKHGNQAAEEDERKNYEHLTTTDALESVTDFQTMDDDETTSNQNLSPVAEVLETTDVQNSNFDMSLPYFAETTSEIIENHQKTRENTENDGFYSQMTDYSTQHLELAAETTTESLDFTTEDIRRDDTTTEDLDPTTGKYGSQAAGEHEKIVKYDKYLTTDASQSVIDFQLTEIDESTPNQDFRNETSDIPYETIKQDDNTSIVEQLNASKSAKSINVSQENPVLSASDVSLELNSTEVINISIGSIETRNIRDNETDSDSYGLNETTTQINVTEENSSESEIPGKLSLEYINETEPISDPNKLSSYRNITIFLDNFFQDISKVSSENSTRVNGSSTEELVNADSKDNVTTTPETKSEESDGTTEDLSSSTTGQEDNRSGKYFSIDKSIESSSTPVDTDNISENTTTDVTQQMETTATADLSNSTHFGPIFTDYSSVNPEEIAATTINPHDEEDHFDEMQQIKTRDILAMIPALFDELQNRTLTVEEQTRFHEMYGALWPAIQAGLNKSENSNQTTTEADQTISLPSQGRYRREALSNLFLENGSQDFQDMVKTRRMEKPNTDRSGRKLHGSSVDLNKDWEGVENSDDRTLDIPHEAMYRRQANVNFFLENWSHDFEKMDKSLRKEKPNTNRYGRELYGSSSDLGADWEYFDETDFQKNHEDRTLDLPDEARYRREATTNTFLENGSQDFKKTKNPRRKGKPNTKRTDIRDPNADWKDAENPDDRTLDIPYEARYRREAPSNFFLENGSKDFQKMDKPQRKEKPNTNRTDRKLHGSSSELDADWEEIDELSLWESREERAKLFKELSKEAWEMLSRSSRSPGKVHPSYYVKEDGAILELINPVVVPTTLSSRDERRRRQ